MDRRNFLRSGAILSSAFVLPLPLSAKSEDRVKLAILGTGWWGTEVILKTAISSGLYDIVGLCDVHAPSLEAAAKVVTDNGDQKPELFSSYREMYEMEGLEAVAIATPTHWHALQFIDACEAGLHVFLEKPISYDIREGQAMVKAHQKAGNVVIVDFPRTMVDNNAEVRKYIESGAAGKILQVETHINNYDANLQEKPVPEGMDFETFCGPAPMIKYLCTENGQKPNWRGIYDINRGILMDWGIHYVHNVRKILGLGLPDSVSAIGGRTRNFTQENPDHLTVKFDFGELPVYWNHKSWGFTNPTPDHNIGIYFYGEKATIFTGDLGWEVYPAGGKEKITHGDIRFRPNDPDKIGVYMKMFDDMHKEFTNGIRNKSNDGITNKLTDAQLTTSSVIYADLAYRVKSGLEIDAQTFGIRNHKAASKMLLRKYRAPYKHPFLS